MAEDLMRYDLLAQDALRSVVRLALLRVRESGLPGEHHFFIAVSINHPGVTVSERLRKKYDEEMTIVLQHQFWNLEVYEKFFEVELSFDNTPEKLIVPYSAVKGFFDPSVQFGLQFEVAGQESTLEQEVEDEAEQENTQDPAANSDQSELPEATPAEASNDDTTVVSLDSFRKKP
ncbi:FIG01011804: hypothetical protein [hydrothermal vent metagenome]|uniref:Stringent starvation protein B n=1 Tax=hydrothermal vent metagenome TaxID=652676 RepID=A0A3B0S4Y8_9ZZZZ